MTSLTHGLPGSPIERLAADFVWGEYDPLALKALAAEALATGARGPALAELARPERESELDVGVLFPIALQELGLGWPSKIEAWLTRLRQTAGPLLAGKNLPAQGAYALYLLGREAHAEGVIDEDDFYGIFVDLLVWNVELSTRFGEPDLDLRRGYVARIMQRARAFLSDDREAWRA